MQCLNPEVELQTTLGNLVLELYPDKAPATVFNFLAQVNSGFCANTLFHRVVPGFVVQGGGYDASLVAKKPSTAAIALETPNGLLNVRGTVGMARGSVPPVSHDAVLCQPQRQSQPRLHRCGQPRLRGIRQHHAGPAIFDSMAQVATGTVAGWPMCPLCRWS